MVSVVERQEAIRAMRGRMRSPGWAVESAA